MGIFKSNSTAAHARSSTGHSIRGKISGPISVSNSLDDSFPFRGPGVSSPVDTYGRTGPADLPLGPLPQPPAQTQHQQYMPMASSPASYAPVAAAATPHHHAGAQYPPLHSMPAPRLPPSDNAFAADFYSPSNRISSHSSPQRTVAGSADTAPNPDPMRFSGVSLAASHHSFQGSSTFGPRDQRARDSSVPGPGPQRKKSTLRNTIGRLFGRRRKDGDSRGSNELDAPIHPIEEEDGPSSPIGARRILQGDVAASAAHHPPSGDENDEFSAPKRSNSLPVTEFDRALRSHSIGPDDMSMIESARNSLQADFGFSRRRAATTTTTGGRAPPYPSRRDTATDELVGLTPRPAGPIQTRGLRAASAMANLDMRADEPATPAGYLVGMMPPEPEHYDVYGEDVDALAAVHHDPGEIGKAITSDGRQFFSFQQHKRRSRSLSGLPNLDEIGGGRRRSEEIRYWRESNDPSQALPHPPPHAISTAVDGYDGGDDGDDPATAISPTVAPSAAAIRVPKHPFNFGAVPLSPVSPVSPATGPGSPVSPVSAMERSASGGIAAAAAAAAIPTTTAALPPHSLTGIEARVRRIEQMMSVAPPPHVSLSAASPSSPTQQPSSFAHRSIFGGGGGGGASSPRASAESALGSTAEDGGSNPSSPRSARHSTSGRMSFGDGPMAGRLHPPPPHLQASQPPPAPAVVVKVVRPPSSSTLRGVSSLPSLTQQAHLQGAQTLGQALATTDSGALTMDHFNALVALINTERDERQELMSQVRRLERRVALITNGTVPVGHVAHRESTSQFVLEPPPTAKSFGERSFFDEEEEEEEDEGEEGEHDNCAELDADRRRCEPHPEDSGVVGGHHHHYHHRYNHNHNHSMDAADDDDDSFADEFFTPREENKNYLSPPHGVGAFGEPLYSDEAGGGKKAARTLSLSQLTLQPPTAY